ncbi:MauE/DoxX family redox-associated membrane protein [Streptosporangium sp. NPDC000396]|uniref:MauE/DoxX family redox-associated membrane protein n=1 Tax=Streptosporangium sp. NPDC000396 TaxID=3366185 RepID=UPI003675A3A1
MVYLAVGCRFLIGVVFAVAAVNKLSGRRRFNAFVWSLRRMEVVPEGLVRPAALVSAAAEVVIVLLLAVPANVPGMAGFAVAAGLLTAFTVGIAMSLKRGNKEPCACFGRSETPLGAGHVVRNLLLIAVTLLGLAASAAGGHAELGEAAIGALAGLVLGALVTAFDDIVALFRPTSAPASPRGAGPKR